MKTQQPIPVKIDGNLLDGFLDKNGNFNPMQALTQGECATKDQMLDMAMDNKSEHFDLIGACIDLLKAQGVQQDKINIMLSDGLIQSAKGRSAYTQRQALNTFWTLQMATLGQDAMKYRAQLIAHGTAVDWLKFFNNGPASFIAQFELPI